MLGRLGLVVVLTLGCVLASGPPLAADQLVLADGGLLSGTLELTELVVQTREGPVRLGRREIFRVDLGTATGDAVLLQNGRRVVGLVAEPRYRIRLPSGQEVAVDRDRAASVTLR
jgi:hypothetical protein